MQDKPLMKRGQQEASSFMRSNLRSNIVASCFNEVAMACY